MVFQDKKMIYRTLLEQYCHTGGQQEALRQKIKQVAFRHNFRMEMFFLVERSNTAWQNMLRDLSKELGYHYYWLKVLREGKLIQQLLVLSEMEKLAWPDLTGEMVACLPEVNCALVPGIYKLLGKLRHRDLLFFCWELQKKGIVVQWEQIGEELWRQLTQILSGEKEEDKIMALEIMARIPSRQAIKLVLTFIEHKRELLEQAWQLLFGYPKDILLKELMYQARFSPYWKIRIGAVKLLLSQKEPETQHFVHELYKNGQWWPRFTTEMDQEGEIVSLGEMESPVDEKIIQIYGFISKLIYRWKEDEEGKLLH